MTYPALDVVDVPSDLLLALVDDFSPTAISEDGPTTTCFFGDAAHRDAAREALAYAFPSARLTAREVDDEDWARRSQQNLAPVTVGRITVAPPDRAGASSAVARPGALRLIINPSMGFGTGHHATTRMCLRALQTLDLSGHRVLDVGTGSGVLAMASRLLGAREAFGVDVDRDAIQNATENLADNPSIDRVRFEVGDLREISLAPADVVTANLTGALLVQSAELLRRFVRPGGTLILSGLLRHERDEVVAAYVNGCGSAVVVWEDTEDDWVGLALNVPGPAAV